MKCRLFVIADMHSFFNATKKALTDAGFFEYEGPKKVVVCGDGFDRGKQSLEMQEFLMDLMEKDQLIYVRGNHEDLMLAMLDDIIDDFSPFLDHRSYHMRNGTLDTAGQLAMYTYAEFLTKPRAFVSKVKQSDFVSKIIPASVDYFETKNHIFVHGWIPCNIERAYGYRFYKFRPDWRKANTEDWNNARWINGMEAACFNDCIEDGKTIVCGHWHASFGHSKVNKVCTEFGEDAIFTPFTHPGIIALDACTAHTGMVNCIVIDDELLED